MSGLSRTLCIFLMVACASCATTGPKGRPRETGLASWYGPGFHGKRTASGETFDRNALTAAHRQLPFGTAVMVRNVRNGRTVTVRINDRGPFSGNRIIDVSQEAARRLGIIETGTAPVELWYDSGSAWTNVPKPEEAKKRNVW